MSSLLRCAVAIDLSHFPHIRVCNGTMIHVCINMAARIITGTQKLDRSLWLDGPERIKYKLSMFMRRCLDGNAPCNLAAHCTPVSATASRHHLHSAAGHQLVVPSYRKSSNRCRAFSVACHILYLLITWNSPPRHLRNPVHTALFLDFLPTYLCHSCCGVKVRLLQGQIFDEVCGGQRLGYQSHLV